MSMAGGTSLVSSVGGGAAAAQAMRLVAVQGSCVMLGEAPKELPRSFHPTQLKIQGSLDVGAVVANFGMTLAVTLLMYLAMKGFHRCFPDHMYGRDMQGLIRFPSAPLFIFQWFYQGTAVSGMRLVFYYTTALEFVVGFAACAVCTVLPFVVAYKVRQAVPKKAKYLEVPDIDGNRWSFVSNAMLGRGEWVSVRKDNHWSQRYASVTRRFTEEHAHFMFVELMSSLALAALSSLRVGDMWQCGVIKLSEAFVFFILIAIEATLWPHARARDCVIDLVSIGAQGSALVFMSIGYFSDGDGEFLFQLSGILFTSAVTLLLVKVGLDLICETYVFCTRRRCGLQQQFWEDLDKEKEKNLIGDDMLVDRMELYDATESLLGASTIGDHSVSAHETSPQRVYTASPFALPYPFSSSTSGSVSGIGGDVSPLTGFSGLDSGKFSMLGGPLLGKKSSFPMSTMSLLGGGGGGGGGGGQPDCETIAL